MFGTAVVSREGSAQSHRRTCLGPRSFRARGCPEPQADMFGAAVVSREGRLRATGGHVWDRGRFARGECPGPQADMFGTAVVSREGGAQSHRRTCLGPRTFHPMGALRAAGGHFWDRGRFARGGAQSHKRTCLGPRSFHAHFAYVYANGAHFLLVWGSKSIGCHYFYRSNRSKRGAGNAFFAHVHATRHPDVKANCFDVKFRDAAYAIYAL